MSSPPSLGTRFLSANSFDEFWDGYNQAFAEAETERFRQWVADAYPGQYSPTTQNVKTFADFFEVNAIPYTLHNLKLAFIYLRAENLLEKQQPDAEEELIPHKYTHAKILRVQKTEEQKASEAHEIAAIGPIGPGVRRGGKLDVDPKLRTAYQRSLQENKHGGKKRHMSEGEARAQTARDFPHLKPDSPEFLKWTARLQFDQND